MPWISMGKLFDIAFALTKRRVREFCGRTTVDLGKDEGLEAS
jgi:hypothetical protein